MKASAADASARHLAGGQQQSATDLHRGVEPGEGLGIPGHVRADRIRQLAHALERGTGRVGGGFGVSKGIHALPDKCH